jgi:hypothetical protein
METTNKTVKQDSQSAKSVNEAVEKAYLAIIRDIKQALALFPTEELRTYVERDSLTNDSHSFYCPMVYISVAEYFGKRLISYAKNMRVKPHIGNHLDTLLIRIIYKHTSLDATKVNIEDRLEEYGYNASKFEDSLKHSLTLDNYKKNIA